VFAFGLIGPLAAWELRRLARRGQAMRVRLVLLYSLFLAFTAFAVYWVYPLPIRDVFLTRAQLFSLAESAEFANRFTLILLEAQLAAILAVTPALAASAVAEEKDRQTLPLLLTTQLTDREIVLGKAAGRIAFIAFAILAGVPVFMLARFFGGIDLAFLAISYATTGSTIVLCSAIGVNAACHTPDLRSAVLRAYARVAVFVCGAFVPPLVLFSPFSVVVYFQREVTRDWQFWLVAVCYPTLQLAVAAFFFVQAIRSLRLRERGVGPPPATAFPAPPRPAAPPLLRDATPRPRALPAMGNSEPILWKERCVSWRPAWTMPSVEKLVSRIVAVAVVFLAALGLWNVFAYLARGLDPTTTAIASVQPGATDSGGWLLMSAGVFAAGRYLLPLTVGLSGMIAGERFRGTLDSLLATPLNRAAVLRAKVQANIERGLAFAATATSAIGIAFITNAGVRVGLAAALLMLSAMVFVVALGSWLSVRAQTDTRAFRLLLPIALLVAGWPAGVWNLLRGDFAVPPELLLRGMLFASGVCIACGTAFWLHACHLLNRGE
jgi:ABC-type transport system involved in multi-copper enzyme maturation permease subunit